MSVGAEPEEAFAAATLGLVAVLPRVLRRGAARPWRTPSRRWRPPIARTTLHGPCSPWCGRSSTAVTRRPDGPPPSAAAAALLEGGGPRDVAVRLTAAALEMAVSLGSVGRPGRRARRAGPGRCRRTRPPRSRSVEGALLRSVRAELGPAPRATGSTPRRATGSVLAHWDRLGLRAYDAGSLARLAEIAAARGDLAAARSFVDEGLAAVEAADTWVAVLGYARAGAGRRGVRRARRTGGRRRARGPARRPPRSWGARRAYRVGRRRRAGHGRAELARVGDREDPDAWAAAVAGLVDAGLPVVAGGRLLRRAEALVGAARCARRRGGPRRRRPHDG